MKNFAVCVLACFSIVLSAQEKFIGTYSDLTYKVDDYVYIGTDSLVVSSVDPYQLEKCKIEISDYSFSINDGGMGFKSKSVLEKPQKISDGLVMYSIKGPYGDKWNVVKSVTEDAVIVAVFHARVDKQPVMNYTLFSNVKMSRSDIASFLLEYLSIERADVKSYVLLEVDKYEISDHPEIAKFIKNTMKR